MGGLKSLLLHGLLIPGSIAFIPRFVPQSVEPFDWDSISPSWDLEFQPCYEELECARLLVPLDWQNTSNPNTIAVAIAKRPAKVPSTDHRFGGTIFFNPGGPGGSGVQTLLAGAKVLQDTVDTEDRFYDFLSFDPRGVWKTTPSIDCFDGDGFSRALWEFRTSVLGNVGSGDRNDEKDVVLKSRLAASKSFGQLCKNASTNFYENGDNILEYVSTASVARDMLAIVDAIDKASKPKSRDQQVILSSELPKIQYWGLSYGTMLGNTFASLFPDRVGRMILDGVVNANDYVSGSFPGSLRDSEAIVQHFYETCYLAGPRCALYDSANPPKSSEDIKQIVETLRAEISASPISIIQDNIPTMFTLTDFEKVTARPWYFPLKSFKQLAVNVANMLAGNYLAVLDSGTSSAHPLKSCPNPKDVAEFTEDVTYAIMCGDGIDLQNSEPSALASIVAEMRTKSPMMAGYWADLPTACIGWPFQAKWKFTGPFSSPPSNSTDGPSVPLLFLSSQYDPVTPLQSAVDMSKKHPSSVVVAQKESYGHGALWSQPSNCTRDIMRKYFAEGVLPQVEDGEIFWCDADCWNPWDDCSNFFNI